MQKNLGYRLQLIDAKLDDTVRAGGVFNFTTHLSNVGWGKIYNPRAVEIVLRHNINGTQYYLPLKSDSRYY